MDNETLARLSEELEAAKRELTVIAALERVRSQALAMQESEDISGVGATLFREYQNLGIPLFRSGVVILDEASDEMEVWLTRKAGEMQPGVRISISDNFEMPQAKAGLDAWRKKDPIYIFELDPRNSATMLRSLEAQTQTGGLEFAPPGEQGWPERLVVTWVFFSHGMLFLTTTEPLAEEKADTALLFAEAFDFAYTRFLELQQLEEQNRALEEANQQIREANRLKSQFLATMSHELRTPMNAIIGFTRLVMRRAKAILPEQQMENLEKVKLSAEHLLDLINDILDLSKVEAGRVEVTPSSFSLERLVANCCATVGPTLGKPEVQLHAYVSNGIDDIYTDEARLRQVIINLLSNALKFTHKGEVHLQANEAGPDLVIIVRDSGIGIEPENLESIFEEFRQVDASNTRKHQGTGLGLAITKKLVELLGGRIEVDSQVSVGTTFTVWVPKVYGGAVQLDLLGPDASLPGKPRDLDVAGGRVIVSIDDDPNVAVLLREELEDEGYRVVSATDADQGIALVRKLKPLAVTVDIIMPGKDGWQTIAMLKADPQTQDIPIIVLSASDNRELGFQMGVLDCLVKPIRREALLAALGRIRSGSLRDILVVDDEPVARELLVELLALSGFEARQAQNGEQAMAEIERDVPDALLLDLMMPVMDGFQVIRRLQENPDWRQIPVIVVTAKDLTSEEQAFLHDRVSRVVQKGQVDSDTLEEDLRSLLRQYEMKTTGRRSP